MLKLGEIAKIAFKYIKDVHSNAEKLYAIKWITEARYKAQQRETEPNVSNNQLSKAPNYPKTMNINGQNFIKKALFSHIIEANYQRYDHESFFLNKP